MDRPVAASLQTSWTVWPKAQSKLECIGESTTSPPGSLFGVQSTKVHSSLKIWEAPLNVLMVLMESVPPQDNGDALLVGASFNTPPPRGAEVQAQANGLR